MEDFINHDDFESDKKTLTHEAQDFDLNNLSDGY